MPESTSAPSVGRDELLGETREAFMMRVRRALGRTATQAPGEPPPQAEQEITRLARHSDDLPAMFRQRAELVGMHVHEVTTQDWQRELVKVLESYEARRLVVGAGSLPQAVGLKDTLRRRKYDVVDWAASPGLAVQFETDAGITDVHAALAETGTLICCSDAGHSRGLSLVPPVHVAIVRRSDILPDMFDFWARWKGIPNDELPSSIAFITGPSKTADIEGQLVKGVHGPKAVHILLVTDA